MFLIEKPTEAQTVVIMSSFWCTLPFQVSRIGSAILCLCLLFNINGKDQFLHCFSFSSVLANRAKVYGTYMRSLTERYKTDILHVICYKGCYGRYVLIFKEQTTLENPQNLSVCQLSYLGNK